MGALWFRWPMQFTIEATHRTCLDDSSNYIYLIELELNQESGISGTYLCAAGL